jgi:phage baseplate assembly protein W
MDDVFKTDLRLVFSNPANEVATDLANAARGLETISGIDNLVQALTVRLLVDQGELTDLSHPLYGSRIRELTGATLDNANLELTRRYVRQTLLSDNRVAEVEMVTVSVRPLPARDIVDVAAVVKAVSGETLEIGVSINA